MSDFSEFEPIGRVTADGRRRVPLGQADDARPGDRFILFQHPDGSILLRPVSRPTKTRESSDA